MAFDVHFYSIAKRENSTALPSGDPISTYQCTLKNECSLTNPDIILQVGTNWIPTSYNYCYIPVFNRYYHIRDWTFKGPIVIAHCDVDVLATYRAQIGASTQYILRSSAEYDGNIIDSIYPAKVLLSTAKTTVTSPYISNFLFGNYVVGIINNDENGVGSVSYYVFTPSQFNAFKNYLMTDTSYIGDLGETMTEGLLKTQFNPFQYVVSCNWYPFSINTGSDVDEIPLGWWTIPANAATISPLHAVNVISETFTIPKHPLSGTRGNYLNASPFSRYLLKIPPFGTVPLDATLMVNSSAILCDIFNDVITGKSVLEVYSDSSKKTLLTRVNGVGGVPIQLAQITSDTLSAIGDVAATVGAVGGAMFSGNIPGAITGAVSGITSAISAAMPQVQTKGANGSIAEYWSDFVLYAEFFEPVNESNSNRGRPLCAERRISSIPGYILVADADISISGLAEENRRIKDYMEGGFFYE